MIPTSVQLIAFDLDDTLWPCMPTIIKAEEALYAWLAEHFPLITNRYSMTSLMGLRNDFALKHPEWQVDLTAMRKAFLAHLAHQCHYPEHDVVEGGFDVFIKWRNTVHYFPDVLPALKKLAQNYVLATLSNGNANVMQTEAAPYISYAINAADVQKAKPDTKMFDVIAQRAQLTASECMYFGDHMEMDVLGARKAGWHAVWVNRDNQKWKAALGAAPPMITSLAGL